MASLQKDARTGLYYAQFFDRSRKPNRKKVALKTRHRRTAERALARLEAEIARGETDLWAQVDPEASEEDLGTLGAAIDVYLASCAHLKPKTIQSYKDVLLPFMRHLGASYAVDRISATCILAWLSTTKAGDITRRKYVNHLGYLFRFLVRKGAMAEDVSKKVPLRRVPEIAPKAMSEEQVETLVRTINEYSGGSRADFRWLAQLVRFNVHVGLRRGELIHLRWKSVDLERRVLRVRNADGFTTKSSRQRSIPLSEKALDVLRSRSSSDPDGFVFHLHGNQLSHNTLTHYFKLFRRKAELPEGINLHSTRHTFATRLAERGVPVVVIQKLMGHSSVTTTERYMSVRVDIAEEWVRRAFAPQR